MGAAADVLGQTCWGRRVVAETGAMHQEGGGDGYL